jgi:hypothetical protein
MKSKLFAGLALAFLPLIGCAAGAAPKDEAPGTTAEALGEPGCATEALTTTQIGFPSVNINTMNWSNGVGYGSGVCPNQVVFEYDNLYGVPQNPIAHVTTNSAFGSDPNSSEASCTASFLTLGVYGYTNGAWQTTPITTASQQGSWTGSSCNYGNLYKTWAWPVLTTHVRLAVAAYQVTPYKGALVESLAPVAVELQNYIVR